MKILLFCGRIHHWQRLAPVADALRKRGNEVVSFCVDNCINNDPSSEYLIPAREPFIDAQSTLDSNDIQRVTQITHEMLASIYSAQDVHIYVDRIVRVLPLRHATLPPKSETARRDVARAGRDPASGFALGIARVCRHG